MRATLALTALVLSSFAAGAVACTPVCSSFDASESGRAGAAPPDEAARNAGAARPADGSRAIAEADIVQLDQEQLRIYAMSRSGALAIVDAKEPGELTLLAKTSIPGEPFEMYRRGDVLLAMSNRAVKGDGSVREPLPPDEGFTVGSPDPTASAVVAAVDVANPAGARTVATFKVPGEIADSRIVGNILYLATYENAACWSCANEPRTLVTTFDISNPLAPRQIDQVGFVGTSRSYKRSVVTTGTRLYVGGVASDGRAANEGVIEVLDIADPGGRLVKGATIGVPGPITSRWQMDEHGGVLRVVSQRGVLRSTNGERYPDVDTFRVESSSSFLHIGHMTMKLPRQEALKTVRFDGERAYAITFAETDPLFTFDLSNPAAPAQKGELVIPGWVFHLEPRGDRLIGLGLDRRDRGGNLNVSLFDVSDMTRPRMLDRKSFGPSRAITDDEITSGVLAEDQDRIQKAFRIFQDGLIAVPFSAGLDACSSGGTSGIQLLSWDRASLTKHALVQLAGNPRRAVRRDSDTMRELIAISDSNVRAFAIDRRDAPLQTADVTIGRCVPRTSSQSDVVNEDPGDRDGAWGGHDDHHHAGSSCF